MGDSRKMVAGILDSLFLNRAQNFSEVVSVLAASASAAYAARLRNIDAGEVPSFALNRFSDVWSGQFFKKYAKTSAKLAGFLFDQDLMELKSIILYTEDYVAPKVSQNFTTPPSLTRLAVKLLDIKPNDMAADIGTGTGTFLREAFNAEPAAIYTGMDIDREAVSVAEVRAEVMGKNVTVVMQNVFHAEQLAGKYEKIFANLPFGLRLHNADGAEDYLKKSGVDAQSSKLVSSDWIYAKAVLDCLKDNGTAVCVMSNGSMYSLADKPIRTHLVRSGNIKAVVSLPEKLFDYTAVPVSLVILGRGSGDVIMVDARNMCRRERRQNVITESDANNIADVLSGRLAGGVTVSVEKLAANDFVLDPSKYEDGEFNFKSGWTLKEISSDLRRGAQFTAAQLDGLVSTEPSQIRYLMLSNIQDGMIEEDGLPYLSKLEDKYDKFCLKDGSLVISKNGVPFKSAVARVRNNEKILANGNLFILDLDKSQTEPYYVKAFLDSPVGEAALAALAQNGAIANISLEALKKLRVPAADLKQQRAVAKKYETALAAIADMKAKLKVQNERLRRIFDSQD